MGYVRNTFGCHCFYGDSSFKRYNRALGGDTLIFNYNSNNTYNCCGGSRGGFWGGLGMGLGMGFGNFLGGLCGNMFGGFGNMFGGFGMGNMFGGFPSWGGFGNWGFGGTPAASSNNNTTTTTNTVTKENKDYLPLKDLSKEVDALNAKIEAGTATQTEIDALVAKLQPYADGKNLDGVQDDTDKKFAQDAIDRLKKLSGTESTPGTEVSDIPTSKAEAEAKLKEMDGAALDKITSDDAKKWLKSLGLIDGDYAKFPEDNNIRALYLIEKSGLNAKVAHNAQATVDDGYIRGQITNVAAGGKSVKEMTKAELDAPAKISYKVNNGTITTDYGLTYSFEQTDDKTGYKITKIKNTGSQTYYIKSDYKDRVYKNGSPLSINTAVLVSKNKAAGYQELAKDSEI